MAVQCVCLQCGKEFSVTPSYKKTGGGKYCSRKCRDLDKITSVTAICEHCNQSFQVQPHRFESGRGRFCSKECFNYHRHKRFIVACQNCGKSIEVKECAIKAGKGKYCSVDCKKAATIERNKRTCESCGKMFVSVPYMIKQGAARFCSKACVGTWISINLRGENSHVWAGGTSLVRYPTEFSKTFKTMIIKRDGYVCAVCRLPGVLHVHHIDYNKNNTVPGNCVSLCRTCHGACHTGGKKTRLVIREYWCSVLTQIVKIRTQDESKCNASYGAFGGSATPIANLQQTT